MAGARQQRLGWRELWKLVFLTLAAAALPAARADDGLTAESCQNATEAWAALSMREHHRGEDGRSAQILHKVLFLLQIPQSGGRIFDRCLLRALYPSSSHCPRLQAPLPQAKPGQSLATSGCQYLATSVDYSWLEGAPSGSVSLATLVRSPLERVVSMYETAVVLAAGATLRKSASLPGARQLEWPWRQLVPILAADMDKRRGATGALQGGVAGSAYNRPDRLMPLEEFVQHPAVLENVHNGATLQLAGLAADSTEASAPLLRRCLARHSDTRRRILDVALARLDQMLFVGLFDEDKSSAELLMRLIESSPLGSLTSHRPQSIHVMDHYVHCRSREEARRAKLTAEALKLLQLLPFDEQSWKSIPPSVLANISSLNALDLDLYRHAAQLFSKRAFMRPPSLPRLGVADLGEGELPPGRAPTDASESRFEGVGDGQYRLSNFCLQARDYVAPTEGASAGPPPYRAEPSPNILWYSHALSPGSRIALLGSSEVGNFNFSLSARRPPWPAASRGGPGQGPVLWFTNTTAIIKPFTELTQVWHLLQHCITLTQLLYEEFGDGSRGQDGAAPRIVTVHLHPTFSQPTYRKLAAKRRIDPFWEDSNAIWALVQGCRPPAVKLVQVDLLEATLVHRDGPGGGNASVLGSRGGAAAVAAAQPTVCYSSGLFGSPTMKTSPIKIRPGRVFGNVKAEYLKVYKENVLRLAGAVDLRSGWCPNMDGRGGPLVTFITRVGSRRLLNQAALVLEAEALGFRVRQVRLELLSLWEQVRVFRESDVVVGSHGSGLTYTFFQHEKAVLLELYPPDASAVEEFVPRFRVGRDLNNKSNYGALAMAGGATHYLWLQTGGAPERFFRAINIEMPVATFRNMMTEIKDALKEMEPCSYRTQGRL